MNQITVLLQGIIEWHQAYTAVPNYVLVILCLFTFLYFRAVRTRRPTEDEDESEEEALPATPPGLAADIKQESEEAEEEALYDVEYIRGHEPVTATSHKQAERYLIKWVGYPADQSTYEPAGQIQNDVPELVRQYWSAWQAAANTPARSRDTPVKRLSRKFDE